MEIRLKPLSVHGHTEEESEKNLLVALRDCRAQQLTHKLSEGRAGVAVLVS